MSAALRAGGSALLVGLLSACGASHPMAPPPAIDSALEQAARSGRQALEFDHPSQAVQQYQTALRLAYARNDGRAIGDCGFDLATAQLAAGDPTAALATARQTRTSLSVRGAPDFAELDLVQAAALFRLARLDEADGFAAQAQTRATDAGTVSRASYLRGLIADARHDEAGLAAALNAFGTPPVGGEWQVDHDLLAARLARLRGQDQLGADLALQAAGLQRDALQYRGMAEAQALAADCLTRAGMPGPSADLYLQAGESAAARNDKPSAENWLQLAQAPGADASTAAAAQNALRSIRALP